jgi:hypothetical protein
MEGRAVGHNFERDPPRNHPCQVWFNLVQRFLRRRFKCDLLSNKGNNKIIELRTILQRESLSDTILKGTHPRTIPARFGLIWFRGFRGEDLNVKVYDVRQVMAKAHIGLWPGELKRQTSKECSHFVSNMKGTI